MLGMNIYNLKKEEKIFLKVTFLLFILGIYLLKYYF
jgi:hypothetical protein